MKYQKKPLVLFIFVVVTLILFGCAGDPALPADGVDPSDPPVVTFKDDGTWSIDRLDPGESVDLFEIDPGDDEEGSRIEIIRFLEPSTDPVEFVIDAVGFHEPSIEWFHADYGSTAVYTFKGDNIDMIEAIASGEIIFYDKEGKPLVFGQVVK